MNIYLKTLSKEKCFPYRSYQKLRLMIYFNEFKTTNLNISNNSSSTTELLERTNLVYIFKCPLGNCISNEKDIDTRLMKAWTAIDRLSIIWKSDLTDKMKRSFFQAAVVSKLLYGCTTWTLTKRLERKLD